MICKYMFVEYKALTRNIALPGLFLVFFMTACQTRPPTLPGHPKPYKVLGRWYQPIPHAKDFRETGIASWYGADFHGKRTANGETYDMHAMSAAHKTLPLGTYVRVFNRQNQKTIDVRINDRGPFVHGRIIDLSYAAAKKLGIVGPGTAPVEIVALGKIATGKKHTKSPTYIPVDYDSGNFTFQVGAFSDPRNAERLRNKLSRDYPNAHIERFDRGDAIFYRVRVGRYTSLTEIQKAEAVLSRDGFPDAFIVAE